MLDKVQKYQPLIMLLVVLVVAMLFWRSSVDRAEQMATLKTEMQNMETRITERAKQTALANAAIDQQVSSAKTPQDDARLIALLAGLKQQPTIVTVPVPTQETAHTNLSQYGETVPDSAGAVAKPGDMIVPALAIKPLESKLADGAKCANSLDACTKDKSDLQDSLKKANDAAKGGSRKTRVGRILLHAVCAGGGGAIGGGISGKGSGAAIGAASGVIGCAIFGK